MGFAVLVDLRTGAFAHAIDILAPWEDDYRSGLSRGGTSREY